MTIDHGDDVSMLLARPDFFPLRLDLEHRAVIFGRMSRDTFRRSSFLDRRAILAGPATRSVGLEEVIERLSHRAADRSAHFILHGAFCGSTLLARYFEELPRCLILKEPHLLAQLSKLGNTDPAAGPGSSAWGEWFDASVALLSRPDAGDAGVVIKAPDQFNWLANELLERDRNPKIIYLCAPLRVFLLSALKSEERREWLRSRGRGLHRQLAQLPLQQDLVVDELTDGQLGAALWLLNGDVCRRLSARADANRILVINSEDLIGAPRETFRAAVEFLGLTRDEDIRSALGAVRPIDYHAKEPGRPGRFDAATRGAVLAQIDERLGPEVDAAMAWVRRIAEEWLSRSPFPLE